MAGIFTPPRALHGRLLNLFPANGGDKRNEVERPIERSEDLPAFPTEDIQFVGRRSNYCSYYEHY